MPGRNAGEKQNNIGLAETLLLQSYQLNPNDAETNRLLGIAYGIRWQAQPGHSLF